MMVVYVLCLVPLALLGGLLIATVHAYNLVSKVTGHGRLLPRHTRAVALSYFATIAPIAIYTSGELGRGVLSWLVPYYGLTSLFSIAVLTTVLLRIRYVLMGGKE